MIHKYFNNINIIYILFQVQIVQHEFSIMMFYPTIGSTYFVKTQTYVALFGPHQLSIIFSGVIYLELSSL